MIPPSPIFDIKGSWCKTIWLCYRINEVCPYPFCFAKGEDENDDDKNSNYHRDIPTNHTDLSPVCNKSVLRYFFDHDENKSIDVSS